MFKQLFYIFFQDRADVQLIFDSTWGRVFKHIVFNGISCISSNFSVDFMQMRVKWLGAMGGDIQNHV